MNEAPNPKPAEPKELKNVSSDRQILCARFSPCGQYLAAGAHDATIRRWQLTGNDLTPLPHVNGHRGWVGCLTFHPTEKLLFSADSWGQLRCQEIEGDAPNIRWKLEAAHDGWIRRMAISPDGKLLATCGLDCSVRIWNATDGKPVARHVHTSDVFAVAFAPDGMHVAFGDMFGRLALLEFGADKVVREFDGSALYKLDRLQDLGGLRALAFVNDGRTLVAAGTLPKSGATVLSTPLLLTFDAASGKLEQQVTHGNVSAGYIEDMAVHPGGYVMAASSGSPGSGMFFFLRHGEKTPFFSSNKLANCVSLALHPDGKRFVVVSTNRDSNGNGRMLKNGEYQGNSSPLHLFEILA